ncbi:MAG: peptidoglycan DD-metalloendopeptidase family protein [Gammaproteobacteria bacterium]|nr:peptidoglycan DD-metalloendopeptidase family protein [Gammaproteobacteria bacterium]
MRIVFFITVFVLLSYSKISLALPQHNPVPGGIALIPISAQNEKPDVFYNKKRVAIISEENKSYALIGVSLNAKPGKHKIELRWPNGRKDTQDFMVTAKSYTEQHLTIKNKRKVNPYKQDMDRILKEKARKNQARKLWSNESVKYDFITPVEGRVSSIFGLRRFFNEQPRRPHSGLDIAAPEGTPIKAVESGTVIESGDFFFSGNMVYIDHGQGLISMYAHMHQIDVKTGDKINKGQIIGTVGETGRVTGPHLHLGIIANQTLVDPVFFLPGKNP